MRKLKILIFAAVFGAILFGTALNAGAETYGNLIYEVSNGEVTITDCDESASGELIIAGEIDGYPVTSIGNSAFRYCDSLESITIPDSVTSVGRSAFFYCSSLTSISVDDNNEYYSSVNGNLYNKNQTIIIQYAAGKEDTYFEIPNSVTSIGDGAFSGCSSLTSITIQKGVTSIERYAFYNCISLTSITIPDSVTSIGNLAFVGCNSLTSITIPDRVTSIGESAFYECKKLASITIPGSVTSIGRCAFYNCSSLASITIQKGVTSIGEYAFCGCNNLTSITIPGSVTSIEYEAFYGCSNLTSITIHDGVTSIGEGAFESCSSLTSITIPGSVTSIGRYAFYRCSNLTKVYYLGNESEWGKIKKGEANFINAKIIYVVRVYKFETNGGSAVADIYNKISECPETVYDGKTFLGWFDNAELSGEPISFPYSGDKTTLYAKWADDSAVKVSLRACSKENGFYNYEFYIISPKAFCGSFIVAGYTKDGKLNEITRNPLEDNLSEYDVSGSIKINSETSFYRYFLWGGENGVTPLCQSEEIDFKSIN